MRQPESEKKKKLVTSTQKEGLKIGARAIRVMVDHPRQFEGPFDSVLGHLWTTRGVSQLMIRPGAFFISNRID